MSNLPVPSPLSELVPNRVNRHVSREITRARAGGAVLAARETARIEAIADVTECALVASSHISCIESMLITRTPHAEQRLRHIADAGCAGMASVVMRMGR